MNNKKRSIIFRVSEKEYQRLALRAQQCNIGVNAYARQLALDEKDNVKLRRGAAKTMACLYHWSEELVDSVAREYMKQGGDMLWQSLK